MITEIAALFLLISIMLSFFIGLGRMVAFWIVSFCSIIILIASGFFIGIGIHIFNLLLRM